MLRIVGRNHLRQQL